MSKAATGLSFLFGVTAGAAVGVGLGFLLAPQSGEKTRKVLKKKINKIIEEGTDTLEQFKEEKIDPQVDKISEQIGQTTENVKKSVTSRIKHIQDSM